MIRLSFLFVVLLFTCLSSRGQDTIKPISEIKQKAPAIDTTSKDLKPRNPKTATLLSLFPGLGQAYNRKYWKMPIIYGGLGVLGYVFNNNRVLYNQNLKQYEASGFTDAFALSELEAYRKNMEINVIMMAGVYLLQIIDANVDAHLSGFDISDDLSLDIQPSFINHANGNFSAGVGLKLHLF